MFLFFFAVVFFLFFFVDYLSISPCKLEFLGCGTLASLVLLFILALILAVFSLRPHFVSELRNQQLSIFFFLAALSPKPAC